MDANQPAPKRVYTVKPDKECKACHGSGEVYDWVPMPFGVGNTPMSSTCDCVYDSLPDDLILSDDDEIIIDLSDHDPTYKLDVREG